MIEDGEIVKKSQFKLDEKGRVTEAELMNEDENYRLVNEHDENGNRVKSLKYNSDDQLIAKQEFSYDEQNQITEIVEEDPHKKNTTAIEYDEQGNATTQKESNRNGILSHELERDYDEDGNVTEVRAFLTGQGQAMARKYLLVYGYEFY